MAVLAYGWESGCGKSRYTDAGGLNGPRIVGGQESRPNEFPWQVSMQSSFGSHYCGAIIINRNWIMTAAHCTAGDSASDLYLMVGEHDRSSTDGPERTYRVSVLRQHENYNQFTLDNDISVMQTTQTIGLSEDVAAVCAPSTSTYAGRTAVVSGWGTLRSGGPCCPQILQYVQVPVISNNECNTIDYPGDITDGMICAGNRLSTDACQGDSGGPLVVKDGETFAVIGIVSWGIGCASGYAGVYARVSTYMNWIGL
uniref:Fibrinolytic protease n=1 Tax=Perinereis aibuhitensis TaxID=126650 RepID=B8Y626_PERAI|nr:fibrinolytic protease [Perinereis aibuhitensis]